MGTFLSHGEQPESYSLDDITFCQSPPEYVEMECPICLLVMIHEPCLVSCCGHHFCRYCIEKAKRSNNCCPYCKKENYDVMADKGLERVIRSLRVKCIQCTKGCQWEGEISGLAEHISNGKREGDCLYIEVECKYKCGHVQERGHLMVHEMSSCDKRPYKCQYCSYEATYIKVTGHHVNECLYRPIHCPNECDTSIVLQRRFMNVHVKNDCPLTVVSCDFRGDGCAWEGERRDIGNHGNQNCAEHLKMVHNRTMKLEKENESLRDEVKELKTLMKKAASEMRRQAKEIEKQQEQITLIQTRTNMNNRK